METPWTKHRIETTNLVVLMQDNVSHALMNRLKARIERRAGKTRYRGPFVERFLDAAAPPPLTPAA